MPWLLIDLLLGLIALVALGFVVLGLWRKVKALSAEVGRAGDALGRATDELAALQAAGADRAQPGPSTPAARPPVNTRRRRG